MNLGSACANDPRDPFQRHHGMYQFESGGEGEGDRQQLRKGLIDAPSQIPQQQRQHQAGDENGGIENSMQDGAVEFAETEQTDSRQCETAERDDKIGANIGFCAGAAPLSRKMQRFAHDLPRSKADARNTAGWTNNQRFKNRIASKRYLL